jgi:lipoprotein-anchoring transpeptidase ErfK/SrfK
LDYIGDKEGFFIYWLKSRDFLDITTFYMTAKFFNASDGQFTKMMAGRYPCDQSNLPISLRDTTNPSQGCFAGNTTKFDNAKHFYYTVNLDYETQTYQISNSNGQRVGTTIPIKWFQYVNP